MSSTLTSATSRSPITSTQLTDIVLGSNPNIDSRWSQRVGRQADIWDVDFDPDGDWSIACHFDEVEPGTVGWIARQGDGGNPPLGGFLVCVGVPYLDKRDGEWYVKGRLHGGLCVPGDQIAAAGWPDRRSPWGSRACRQFRNAEEIKQNEVQAILKAVPHSVLRTIALEHLEVTGHYPWWAT